MNRLKRFAANAAIMGGVSIFMRLISVAFNAYAANTVGAEGMGVYSLITSVYIFAVTLATSGINLAVTRLVSEELAHGNERGAICAVRKCVSYSLIFGFLAAALMFSLARPIGERILCDERTVRSLRALSVSLPFIALSNVLAGYFNAVRRISKSASASVAEQFVKIGITVLFLQMIMPRTVEHSCLSLVLGTSISEGLSFIYLAFFYFYDKKKHLSAKKGSIPQGLSSRMLRISLPIAASAYLRSALVTVEHILIPFGLRRFGAGQKEALASYGTIHGMVFPLIFFPSAVTSTFASLIVPELSELSAKYGKRDAHHIKYVVSRAITMTVMFGTLCAGVFILFSEPLGMLVYKSAEAARYIGVFAVLIPLMYLDTAVDGMLKGLNEQLASMKYNIIDAAISVFLVYTLLPKMGIWGYVVCVFATELVNDVLSLSRLLKVTGVKINIWRTVFCPLLSVIGAGTVTNLFMRMLPFDFYSLVIETVCGIFVLTLMYAAFLLALGGLSGDDVAWVKSIFSRKKNACV